MISENFVKALSNIFPAKKAELSFETRFVFLVKPVRKHNHFAAASFFAHFRSRSREINYFTQFFCSYVVVMYFQFLKSAMCCCSDYYYLNCVTLCVLLSVQVKSIVKFSLSDVREARIKNSRSRGTK